MTRYGYGKVHASIILKWMDVSIVKVDSWSITVHERAMKADDVSEAWDCIMKTSVGLKSSWLVLH